MYKEGQEYNIKYINGDGQEVETKITPEQDLNKPQMIMKLKEEDKNFFKLLENKEIKKESTNMKSLYDALEERKFEDIDIADDENGDLLVAFCLDPEEGDSDTYNRVLTKIAKGLEVYEEQENVIICKVTDWVRKHKDILVDMFEVAGPEEDDIEEELVGTTFPGIVSGYITDDAYNELDSKLTESKEIKTESYADLPQMEIYEYLVNGRREGQERAENVKLTAEAVIEDHLEQFHTDEAKDELISYIMLKANEIYNGDYDEKEESYKDMEDVDKEVKTEGYTAREALEARLAKYSNDDKKEIKVVAETENYILTVARRNEEGYSSLNLSVTTGSNRDMPNVYIDQDYKGKCTKAEINWGAFGNCSITETKEFISYLQEATEFAEQIEGKDFSTEL